MKFSSIGRVLVASVVVLSSFALVVTSSASSNSLEKWLQHSLPTRNREQTKRIELMAAYSDKKIMVCHEDAYQLSQDSVQIATLDNSFSQKLNEAFVKYGQVSNALAWAYSRACKDLKSVKLRALVIRDRKAVNKASLVTKEIIFAFLKS